jgi:hypothetical protein
MGLFSNKALRLLLAVSVSIWMAGGCLFGCSNSAMAAHVSALTESPAASGESCHAQRSHDCCATAKPAAKKRVVSTFKLVAGATTLASIPRGPMNDCPLVVGSTAATSKNSTSVPNPERAPVAARPSFEKQTEHTENTLVAPFLPSRGPTYLRCCVFLI